MNPKNRKINFSSIPNINNVAGITVCLFKFSMSHTWRICEIPEHLDNNGVRELIRSFAYEKNGVFYVRKHDVDDLVNLLLEKEVIALVINYQQSLMN